MTSRANALCLLKVLSEFSDADHILGMQDIIKKLKTKYSIDIDRRTVYSTIELLNQHGYDISIYNENGVGYYLRERDFETSEVRLLMDAVYSHQAISIEETQRLIKKLQTLLNFYNRKNYLNLTISKNTKKTTNREIFLNIEVLDEAIQKKIKVQFDYLEYGFDKRLKPRRDKKYTVNPYRMLCANEHYYLLCKMAYKQTLSMYRIDLMQNVSLTEYLIDENLTEQELMTAENRTIYAWYGATERVEIRCKDYVLGDVIDKFGQDVVIVKNDDDTFSASMMVAPWGVKYWALQYLPHVEVLRPDWLRDEIIKSIDDNPYKK